MKNSIISHEHNMTHTEIIKMNNDWSCRYDYDCIMKEFGIPTYAAKGVTYNPLTNETVLKFTWTTIEKGII